MFQNIHGFIGSDYNLVKHCYLQGLSQYLIESKRIKWKFRKEKKEDEVRSGIYIAGILTLLLLYVYPILVVVHCV